MANEDDDDFFGDEDFDEAESLLVLEQAEKQHAASISASQATQSRHAAPPASSANIRATSLPVKPIPQQNHQAYAQRHASAVPPSQSHYRQPPAPSQQQRSNAATARPILPSNSQAPQFLSSQQRQPNQQVFKPPPPVKSYPSNHNSANATAGPSRYTRQPVRPVYKDDFPDVEVDENGKGYRARGSAAPQSTSTAAGVNGHAVKATVDDEKQDLKKQLAELQKSLQEEQKVRQAKEGEVNILRRKSEKQTKEYEAQLQSELSKIGPLQERINQLEAMLSRESSKHSSELIFQKQEIESKYRNVAANAALVKSARKAQLQNMSSQMARISSQVQSPRKQYKTVKTFQNSFAEPMTSTQHRVDGGRLPSSPSDGRAAAIPHRLSPRSRDKGKQREVIDPSSEMDYNDIPDMQEDVFDPTFDEEDHEQNLTGRPATNARDEITSFVFDHMPHHASGTSTTIFSLVNADFPSAADPERIQAHRDICQRLFFCFGHRPETPQHDTQQDVRFLRSILFVLLDFMNFFSLDQASREEAMLAVHLISDLCQRYTSIALACEADQSGYEDLVNRMFKSIRACIDNERKRLTAIETVQPLSNVAVIRSRAALAPRSRQARNEAEKMRFEKEVEGLFCSLLHLLQFLTLRPDATRIAHIDAFLRDSSCLAFSMDARRCPAVHLESLFLVALLTCRKLVFHPSSAAQKLTPSIPEPPLFRSLLSTPFQDDISGARTVAPATAANRPQQLPFVEYTASFLSYRMGDTAQSQAAQQLALISLSNLLVSHADGTPLLSRSPSLVQRLVMRIAQDASQLYDHAASPPETLNLSILLRTIEASMRLLYHLVLSQDGLKGLSAHLSERPFGRDYFVAGVGRIACTEVPEWIESPDLAAQLDQLANVGFELLEDVLSPDEVDDVYLLCRDEDEADGDEAEEVMRKSTARNEEEEMAAQNIDAMES